MTKEIMTEFSVNDQATTVSWLLRVSDDKVISFAVRMPTEVWHYYLPLGIDIHETKSRYDGHCCIEQCKYLNGKQCFCDGSSLSAQELWDRFILTGNENLIWSELEKWI